MNCTLIYIYYFYSALCGFTNFTFYFILAFRFSRSRLTNCELQTRTSARTYASTMFKFFIFFLGVSCVHNRSAVGVYPSLSLPYKHTYTLFILITVVVSGLHVQNMRLWQVLASVVNISVTVHVSVQLHVKVSRCLRFNWMYDFAWTSSISFSATHILNWRPKTVRFDLNVLTWHAQIPGETLNLKKHQRWRDSTQYYATCDYEQRREWIFSPNTFE